MPCRGQFSAAVAAAQRRRSPRENNAGRYMLYHVCLCVYAVAVPDQHNTHTHTRPTYNKHDTKKNCYVYRRMCYTHVRCVRCCCFCYQDIHISYRRVRGPWPVFAFMHKRVRGRADEAAKSTCTRRRRRRRAVLYDFLCCLLCACSVLRMQVECVRACNSATRSASER